MSQIVFVFGTLKEGLRNLATNKGARVARDFITVERMEPPEFSPRRYFSFVSWSEAIDYGKADRRGGR